MPSTPLSPEKRADAKALAQAIREATAAEIDELACTLIATDDTHPFGPTEFTVRGLAHKVAAKAFEQHLARKKNGYHGGSVTCPHCDRAAAFHGHCPHTPTSLVGPVRYHRAYYLCRRCGRGLCLFDQQAGLTARHLTPGLERVVTLAATVADSFEKGADLVQEMAGTRLGESTVERTTEDAGARLAGQLQAGRTFGPKVVWPWHKDYQGRTCAYVENDATGVRQQGPGGAAAEGRMAYVGVVCNPAPEWLWPDERRAPMQARSVAGLYALEEVGPLLRRQAAQAEVAGYLERNAHRAEYPEYLAEGWYIGSGAVESACQTVVGQRLKLAGMRWGEDGADALCHLRALYRSEKGQWDAFWIRASTN